MTEHHFDLRLLFALLCAVVVYNTGTPIVLCTGILLGLFITIIDSFFCESMERVITALLTGYIVTCFSIIAFMISDVW